jgi:hypothetical protein
MIRWPWLHWPVSRAGSPDDRGQGSRQLLVVGGTCVDVGLVETVNSLRSVGRDGLLWRLKAVEQQTKTIVGCCPQRTPVGRGFDGALRAYECAAVANCTVTLGAANGI